MIVIVVKPIWWIGFYFQIKLNNPHLPSSGLWDKYWIGATEKVDGESTDEESVKCPEPECPNLE